MKKFVLTSLCFLLLVLYNNHSSAQSYIDGHLNSKQKQLYRNNHVQETKIKLYGHYYASFFLDTLGRLIKYVNLPEDNFRKTWDVFAYDDKDRLIGRKHYWLKKRSDSSADSDQQTLMDTLTDSWAYVFDSTNRLCRTLHTDMLGNPGYNSSEYKYDGTIKLWTVVNHSNWGGHYYSDTLLLKLDSARKQTRYNYFRSNHAPSNTKIRNYDMAGNLISELQYSFLPDSVLTHSHEYIYSGGWLTSEEHLFFGWKKNKKSRGNYTRREYDSLGNTLGKESGTMVNKKRVLNERYVYKYYFSSDGLPKFIWSYILKSGKLNEESMFELEYSFYR